MKIAKMRKMDISNGPGIRTTLFVSGCTHNCKGCFNKKYQDFSFGKEMTIKEIEEFLAYTMDEKIVGVNILGGEPLQQIMDNKLPMLLSAIKTSVGKPIWLWTGYKLEDVIENDDIMNILKYVDVLIDGKFDENLKDLRLKYRGSKNQRVIDMNYYRSTGVIKELENLTL